MKKYVRQFPEEKDSNDLNELVGYLKAKYRGDSKRLQQDPKFKKLQVSDKEYILDELNSEGENL